MLISQARRFGEALVDRHVLTREVMDSALEEASRTGAPFPTVLEGTMTLPDTDLAAAWAAATGSVFVDFASEVIHPEAVSLLPEDLIVTHRAVPIRIENHELLVAFPAPAPSQAIRAVADHLVSASGPELLVGLADASSISDAIDEIVGGPPSDDVHSGQARNDNTTELYRLFDRVLEFGGSDLHLAAGQPPFMRVVGELIRMPDEAELTATRVRELVYSILTVRQQAKFEEIHELDTSHAMGAKVRFRVNVFLQRNAVGAAFRVIPYEVVDFDLLGLPEVVKTTADFPHGLVLVTGPAGSGKSTTLASLVDIVNRTRHCHIMTIEDPIEFVHRTKVALVNQREVGEDTNNFGAALTSAMRQDPDVILVGEIRDLETISTAISAAETGHLVFATLHTQDAAQTVDRIIDVFPGEQQGQIRVQLANSLQAVATQQLVPSVDGRSRVVACEFMFANNAIRALIRDGKIHQIHNAMTSGKRMGMQTMDDSLADLVRRGLIDIKEALRRAKNPDDLQRLLGGTPNLTPPSAVPPGQRGRPHPAVQYRRPVVHQHRRSPAAARRGAAGFTISEFVLVVGMFVGLIIVVVVSVNGIDSDAAERECRSEFRAIKAASERFKAELTIYPPNDQALQDAGYLDLEDTPNWKVQTAEQDADPEYVPVGGRCD